MIDRLENRNVSTAGGLTRHTGPVPFMLVAGWPPGSPVERWTPRSEHHQHRGAPCMRRRLQASPSTSLRAASRRSRAIACHHPVVDLAGASAVRDGTRCRHPWETERARFSVLIDRHTGGVVPRRTLDVGAGDEWFAAELPWAGAPGAEIVCWDVNYSRDVDADLGAGIVRTTDGPDGLFDLVLLLDVIEHIDDDGGFLDAAVIPHLTPSSLVVVGVPAWRLFVARRGPRPPPALLAGAVGRPPDPRLEIVSRGGLFASLLPVRAAAAASASPAHRRPWRRRLVARPGLHPRRARRAGRRRPRRWLAGRPRAADTGLSTWAVCRPAGRGDARG